MPGNLPDVDFSSWPTPNYVDPVERTWMPAYSITLTVASSIPILIRLFLRFRNEGGGLGLDDLFLVPGWLLNIGFTTVASYASYHTFVTRHVWDTPPTLFEGDALNAWISQILFLLGPGCVKISVLLFYRRIQAGTFNRRWLWCIYGAIWLTVAFTLAFLLALVFNCQPTRAYWKLYDFSWNEEYKCAKTTAINLVAGLISLIADMYAIGLPCFMVQGLKMRRREKITMNAVFLLSLSVVGAGSARTWAFFTFASDSDVTWSGFWVFFYCVLEYNLMLICACAPSLRVFAIRYLHMGGAATASQKPAAATDDLTSMDPHPQPMHRFRHSDASLFSFRTYRSGGKSRIRVNEVGEEAQLVPPTPTLPPEVYQPDGIRTPKHYEEYVLQVLETSRKSQFLLGTTKAKPLREKDLPPLPSPSTVCSFESADFQERGLRLGSQYPRKPPHTG
ncbi:hypothetical protein KC349_g1464 [Hortaea werneckii]|nr:hypothetical protein KC349_g1464 [Hortaea werneckii]